jgi:alpha-amylase/alpha-mannosidase (GH57 family)
VAGSWVYGTFSTWIGDADKNRGWDLLCEAKQAFDTATTSGRLSDEQLQQAQRQLAICEGSDWFWWFGDYNPEDSVRDFDRLYRRHLVALYQLIGVSPPASLADVISQGGGEPAQGGVMRPGKAGGH